MTTIKNNYKRELTSLTFTSLDIFLPNKTLIQASERFVGNHHHHLDQSLVEEDSGEVENIIVKIFVTTIGVICGKNQLKFCEFLNSQDFKSSF